MVVDHYAFDARWHESVRRELCCRILVIDDMADRALSADILIDHNWADDHREKYKGRTVSQPTWLIGPRFALISSVYRTAPRYAFKPTVRSVGIFMGGTDPDNSSERVLECVRAECGFSGPIEVVSTSSNPHLHSLELACAGSPATLLTIDEPDLAAFFARHDLQIGAGGGATWERCCIGAPTIGLLLSENQAASLPGLHRLGALCTTYLPNSQPPSQINEAQPLDKVFRRLLVDTVARHQLCETAVALVDGRGAQRVALRILGEALNLRLATEFDAPMLHGWRNHPAVREMSLDNSAIPYADHLSWMRGVLCAADRWLLIGQVGTLPVGCIRFDRIDRCTVLVSLYLDPDLQGLGLGRRLLLSGENYVSRLLGPDMTVLAEVVAGNQSSRALFESCGYRGGPTTFTKLLPRYDKPSDPLS
jgi:UDP-2,4-diacetamido-2,4,6-trideoxy-beta-L-altropyranose hydrolase